MHKIIFTLSAPAALLAAALGIGTRAEAAPLFPPAHLAAQARFATAVVKGGGADAGPVAKAPRLPWYFVAQPRPAPSLGEAVDRGPAVATSAVVRSWYRAAN